MKRRGVFIMRRARRFSNGLSDYGRKPTARFRKKLRPFAAEWPPTAVTKNRARVVAQRFNGSATPPTRPIIARTVRQLGSYSPTARSRDYYAKIGPKLRKNLPEQLKQSRNPVRTIPERSGLSRRIS